MQRVCNDMESQVNKNAGFSLIELIITILIMATLAGGAVIAVSQITKTSVTAASDKLVAVFEQARYENLYQEGSVSFGLEYSNGSYYAVNRIEQEDGTVRELRREEIGNNKIEVYAVTTGGSRYNIAEDPITIGFYKSNGALQSIGAMYEKIYVENAAKKAEISLVEHTGRCYLDIIN